ncbi:MAG: Y-family DNA polymerase [Pyrinomonadaceae bacterium]
MMNAFALVDCNNFYASTERVFNPKVQRRPIVVLSNNDGCVIARSEEAKQIGVTMGAPLFKVQDLLDDAGAEVFSSNYELYGDMSARVMENLREFTPRVEVYSIDEAFLELDARRGDLGEIGFSIRDKIKKWTGIPISVGIAETKTLAKLANRLAKKSEKTEGVLDIYRSPHLDAALQKTAVRDVWGIGSASAEKLDDRGIRTALELREADLRWVRKRLTVVGARTVLELRGVSCLPLELTPPPKKTITCSRSFGQTIEKLSELREAIAFFLARAAEKLRRHQLAANSVTVFIGTDRFHPQPLAYENSAVHKSIYLSDTDYELRKWAFACLISIYRQGFAYRRAGLILSGLTPVEGMTCRMFDQKNWERFRSVMAAVDEINRKFGRDTVRFAVARPDGIWRGRSERRSDRYTTRFGEIAKAR